MSVAEPVTTVPRLNLPERHGWTVIAERVSEDYGYLSDVSAAFIAPSDHPSIAGMRPNSHRFCPPLFVERTEPGLRL